MPSETVCTAHSAAWLPRRARRTAWAGSLRLSALALLSLWLVSACQPAPGTRVTPQPAVEASPLPTVTPVVTQPAPTSAPTQMTAPAVTPTRAPIQFVPTATPEGTFLIIVGDYYFEPPSVTVPVGTTIVWRAVGELMHTIAPLDPPDGFKKGYTAGMGSPEVSLTFDKPGTYKYYCDYHPGAMDALLVVTAGN